MSLPQVDPNILGQLLLLQSSLQAASDVKGLGEQICYVLKKIKNVESIGLYIEGNLVTQTTTEHNASVAWPPTWEEVTKRINEEEYTTGTFHKIAVQTSKKTFGHFSFLTNAPESFSNHRPYIENTINMAALILENWQQAKELKREKNFLQAVLDNVQDGIVACDQKGILTLFNHASRSIHGIPEKPIPSSQWAHHYDLFLNDGITRMEENDIPLFRALNSEHVKDIEMIIAPKNNPQRTLLGAAQPLLDSKNNVLGAVATMKDVTDQKIAEDALKLANDRLEEKIQERTQELQLSNEKLAKEIAGRKEIEGQLRQAHKMEAIGTLAGGIAHDFNNILAVILGFADLARDDIPSHHPAKSNIDEIIKAGYRAKDLVKQILSFSRKEDQESIPVELKTIVKEVLLFLRSSIPTTIEIKQNIDIKSGVILAEPTKIHQIIMNICTNAAQAMEENGGVLELSLDSCTLTKDMVVNGAKPGEYVRVIVKDTGIGINEDLYERIFDPYFTTKEIGKGSGMGLAVVAGIIRSHNGMINVESKPGEWSTFSMYFPKIEGLSLQEHENIAAIPTGKEQILIVDDEENLAELTKMRVERLGYQAIAETSSKKALELFKSQPDFFDLVISDQTMPELTGETLAKEILKIRKNMPIIICSGYSSKIDAVKSDFSGIKAFMTKPFDNTELAETIRKVLDLEEL